jgi:tRNA(Ile)-lysidine synthase TilS/MesJ
MDLCRIYNCNKLALGHHLDDIVATLLMSMAQHARFGGMAVKLNITIGAEKSPLTIIRPLCLIAEDEIRAFVAEQGYSPEKCRCPWGDVGLRKKSRAVVDFLCEGNEQARLNLFRSQFNITRKFMPKHVEQPTGDDIEDVAPPERSCS